MGKSSSGRDRTGSESTSRSERGRDDGEDPSRRRSGADSMTASSRRKSGRRGDYDDDGASFAPTITAEPSEISDRRRDGSRREDDYDDERRRSSKSKRSSKEGRDRGEPVGGNREDSRRDSRSGSYEKGNTRRLNDHDAALPQNQFPGTEPATYTKPYLPPGQASEYYGDQGQSVQYQPGVRPNQPSIVTSAEQAHLMQPTQQAKPPPEPSSQGNIGAAAGYFGSANYESDSGQQTTPSRPARRESLAATGPSKHSTYGASPRSSPGPQSVMPPFGPSPSLAGSVAPVLGEAASYYAGGNGGASASTIQTPNRPPPGRESGSTPYSAPPQFGGSQQHSNAALYGGAAAIAGAAAGAYMSQSHEHSSYSQHQTTTHTSGGHPLAQGTQMQHNHRHKHTGVFGRFVDWWRDPEAIAQYEQYTEAIGVCKYCFDPMSTPADAPRRHGYRGRRPSSGSRYGSSTRVDKTYRYSSDEERRKRSSVTKKVALGGLAGYGVGKVGEAVYKQQHDFDDTYSIKSVRPTNQSRVSFQDAPQQERYGDVRLQRRDSDRKLRRSDVSSQQDKRRRRRSSSSSSKSSSHGRSRRTAMSTGAAAAGLAIGAAALDRQSRHRNRSRSRSPTSKKKYYSRRVSPMHSYVDLSTTNDGPSGLVGFFTSPSANAKKGKKSKGFFNFANNSSSSSDADLRFGEGTVRRKPSNRQLRKSNRREEDHSTAAMMGMVAAGTALAAEVDRRHENGKQRRDADDRAGRNSRHTSEQKIHLENHENGGRDDEWYDTDGDAESDMSVDTALAYGGGILATQSRPRKSRPSDNFRDSDQRRYHNSMGPATQAPVPSYSASMAQTAALAGAAGAIGGWAASNAMAKDGSSALPPMRDVEPRPISNPHSTAVSPQFSRVSSTNLPLQQPQPIVPVASFIDGIGAQSFDGGRQPRRDSQQDPSERRRQRRDSSPAKLPNQDPRGSVNFSLTDEQLQSERRATDRGSRRKDGGSDKDRRMSADASKSDATSREDPKSRPRRSSEAGQKLPETDDRVTEIEQELEKLYREHRQAEERKRNKDSGLKKVAEGAAIGAAAAVAVTALAGNDRKTGSGEDTQRRKSSLKKSRDRESSPPSESQQERIARMAAQRVKSTPSPVQHDAYSSFFVPVELRENLKEHNDTSEHRDDIGAHVVEVVPGAAKTQQVHWYDPYTYRQFGLELEDDPSLYPWPVPMLGLVEPTPPGSIAPSVRGEETPVVEPTVIEPPEEFGEPLERRGSKVTWGDHDTYVYEVQTPMDDRTDFMRDVDVDHVKTEEIYSADDHTSNAEDAQHRPNVGRTWTLNETEAESLEKEVPFIDDRPRMSRAWTVDDEEADQIEDGPEPLPKTSTTTSNPDLHFVEIRPATRDAGVDSIVPEPDEIPRAPSPLVQNEAGRTQAFYESPFGEPVNDSGIATGVQLHARSHAKRSATITKGQQEHGLLEDETAGSDIPATPPGARLSKSERRRRERATPSTEEASLSMSEQLQSEPDSDAFTPMPGNDSVFDYMVDHKGSISIPPASVLGIGASAILAADQVAKGNNQHEDDAARHAADEHDQSSKPKRSSTFDESTPSQARSGSKTGYQSDPEDWERSSDKKSRKSKSSSKSDVGGKNSSKSKDRRRAEEPDSVQPSIPAAIDELDGDKSFGRSSARDDRDPDEESITSRRSRDDEKKSRSRRSRDADEYRDDDSRSVASSGADSKGKKKESGGFFGGIFSNNKSDVSSSSKKGSKSSKSESRAERECDDGSESRSRRKSKDTSDFDDVALVASESARRSRPSLDDQETAPKASRDQSLDDGFVSAEEIADPTLKDVKNGESFLANRPEMPAPTVMHIPMGTDGVSGLTSEREPSTLPDKLARDSNLESSPVLPQLAESRRLSAIRTTDIPSSPITTSSPTAVPLSFRRVPLSPTNPRFTMSSPGAAPTSPLSTPRTRQSRPKSTEFRNSKEFRPLYLVERQNFAKTPALELEEDLPSLPSSRTSSAHPSMEDLRAEAQAQEQSEFFLPSRMSAEMFRERGRRHSQTYWHDNERRRESPDYLDSRAATPVPGEAQRARDQDTKPRPKYEFHSPSELLQDPAMMQDVPDVDDRDTPQSPLPSVASTDLDLDYMSARSRSLSPSSLSRGRRSASTTRSTSASWHDAITTPTAEVGAGSILGIAAQEVLEEPSNDVPPRNLSPKQVALPTAQDQVVEAGKARDVSMPVIVAQSEVIRRVQESGARAEAATTSESPQGTVAWKNVFADIQNRKSVPRSAVQKTPAEVTMQPEPVVSAKNATWDNVFAEMQNRKRGLDTVAKRPPKGRDPESSVRSVTEDTRPAAADVPPSSGMIINQSSLADDPVESPYDQNAEDTVAAPDAGSKKSKKDKKGKKKSSTLNLDYDLPAMEQESVVRNDHQAKPMNLPQLEKPRSIELEQPSNDKIGSTGFDESQNQRTIPEPQDGVKGDVGQLPSPLETAFEAAFDARGLAHGASVQAAYQSFQPEVPDLGGTQLTTIEEESDLPIPEAEKELILEVDDASLGRRSSKKDKRKSKKGRQTSFEDYAEPDTIPAELENQPRSQVEQSQDAATTKDTSTDYTLAESTPTAERPNPFGDDFELKPAETEATSVTVSGVEASGAPTEAEDSWQLPSKKSKKDKKKKRQSESWDDPVPEQNEPTEQIRTAEPIALETHGDKDIVEQIAPSSTARAEEDVFATPSGTPQQESEDPWEMGTKSSKKKKSKSKKSLLTSFEDLPTSIAAAPVVNTDVPAYEASRDFELDRDARFRDDLVEEPDENKTDLDTLQQARLSDVPQASTGVDFADAAVSQEGHEDSAFFGSVKAQQLPSLETDHQAQEQSSQQDEDFYTIPTKKSKKDKKKKRTVTFDDIEPEAAADDPYRTMENTGTPRASSHADEQREVEAPALPESVEAHGGLPPTPAENISSSPTSFEQTPMQDDDFFTTPAKKSKKDKKKAWQATLTDTEIPIYGEDAGNENQTEPNAIREVEMPETPGSFPAEPEDLDPTEDAPRQDEDFFAVPTKKSKKDKKKKRGSTFDLDEPDLASPAEESLAARENVLESSAPEDVTVTGASSTVETSRPRAEPVSTPADRAPPDDDDDDYDVFLAKSTKKSKKEKKKRRTPIDAFDDTENNVEEQAESLTEPASPAVPEQVRNIDTLDDFSPDASDLLIKAPLADEFPDQHFEQAKITNPPSRWTDDAGIAHDFTSPPREISPGEEHRALASPEYARLPTALVGNQPEVDDLTDQPSAIEPLMSGALPAEDAAGEPSVVETAVVEPPIVEVPTVQSPTEDVVRSGFPLIEAQEQAKAIVPQTVGTHTDPSLEPREPHPAADEAPFVETLGEPPIVEPSNDEVVQVNQTASEQLEEDWGFPVKNSKKDKKSKRQTTLAADPEAPPPASSLPESLGPDRGVEDVSHEVAVEYTEASRAGVAAHDDVQDDWAPTSKSKKDKKKKKRQLTLAFDPEEDSGRVGNAEEAAQVSELVEAEPPMANLETATDEATQMVEDSAGSVVADALKLDRSEPEAAAAPPVEDDWAFTPSTSKKEKKTKKRQSVLTDDAFAIKSPADADSISAAEPRTLERETLSSIDPAQEQPIPTKPVMDTASSGNVIEVDEGSPQEVAEERMPTGMSKKDKKKKNRQSTLDLALDDPIVDDSKQAHSITEGVVEPSDASGFEQSVEEFGEEKEAATLEEQLDDAWAPAVKKKKDKKASRKSKLGEVSTSADENGDVSKGIAWPEPHSRGTNLESVIQGGLADRDIEAGQVRQAMPIDQVGMEEPTFSRQVDKAAEDEGPDYFSFSTKKTKQKKKRQPFSDEPETTDALETPTEEAAPREAFGTPLETTKAAETSNELLATKNLTTAGAEGAEPTFEDEWATNTTANSRKSKKKQRQSMVEEPETMGPLQTPTERDDPFQTPFVDTEPVADETWADFVNPKSKKSKKKRQSTFEDVLAEPSPFTSEAELAQKDELSEEIPRDVSERQAPEARTFAQDDAWDLPKKSKKEKKNRQSTFDDAFADPAPAVGRRDTKSMREEPEVVLESGNDVRRGVVVDPTGLDITTSQAQLEEDEWNTSKKSKKEKKKKRQSNFTDIVDEPMAVKETPIEPESEAFSQPSIEVERQHPADLFSAGQLPHGEHAATQVIQTTYDDKSEGRDAREASVEPTAEMQESAVPTASHFDQLSAPEYLAAPEHQEVATLIKEMNSVPTTNRTEEIQKALPGEQVEVLAREEVWMPNLKKSKKKKRQSTFDEAEIDSVQPERTEFDDKDIETTTQTAAEPSAVEDALEAEWAAPSKKLKKGKKQRLSPFDESALDLQEAERSESLLPEGTREPDLMFEPAMLDVASESAVHIPTNERLADEDWTASSKKAKKDKKKRRTLLAEDESLTFTPAEEQSTEQDLTREQPSWMGTTTGSLERPEADAEPGDYATAEAAAMKTEPDAPKDEWAMPAKSSKKDKKKKRQMVALGEFDMDTLQGTTPADPVLLDEPVRQAEVAIAARSSEDSGVEHVKQSMIEPDFKDSLATSRRMPDHADEPFDEQHRTFEDMGPAFPATESDPVAFEQSRYLQEPELDHPMSEASADRGRQFADTTIQPASVEPEWPSVKTSKKDRRKSQRQSTFEDEVEPQEAILPRMDSDTVVREADPIADTPQRAAQVASQPEDDWGFPTKKSKKSKKSKALMLEHDFATPGTATPASTDQFESAAQTPIERATSPEPMEGIKANETQAENNAEDYFTPEASKKKDKKDKKKKSLLAWGLGDQDVEDTSEPVKAAPVLQPGSARALEVGAGVLAASELARGGHGVDSIRGTKSEAPKDDLQMSTLAGPDIAHDQWASNDKYDPTSRRFERDSEESARGIDVDAVPIVTDDRHDSRDRDKHVATPMLEYTAAHQSEHESRFEPTRSVDRHQTEEAIPSASSRNDYFPAEHQSGAAVHTTNTPQDLTFDSSMPENVAESESLTRKKSKKDKKAKKERRTSEFDGTEDVKPKAIEPDGDETRQHDVLETIHEENRHPSPTHVPFEERRPSANIDSSSDVSESTRERRRRRRSPQMWAGEELGELPKDRALTPPPEHDDFMDTALGVAAGLGFGGGEHESTREPPPKPPSPARQPSAGWSFARLGANAAEDHNRDSGVQFESPVLATDHFSSTRDSGFIPSPATVHGDFGPRRDNSMDMKLRPPRPQSPTSSTEDLSRPTTSKPSPHERSQLETPKRKPSPVESTSKDRSSVLFNSSPAILSPLITTGASRSTEPKSPLQRSPSIHGHHHSREELRQQKTKTPSHHEESDRLASNLIDRSAATPINRAAFESEARSFTPGKPALHAIQEHSTKASPSAHPFSEPHHSQHSGKDDFAAAGLVAAAGLAGAAAASRDPGTKSLGRSKSRTSSLRNLRGNSSSPFDPAKIASGSSQDPANARDTGKSAVRDRDMADIYDGYGSYPGSPKSPTRPPSVRRRQSMQQIQDLEARLNQLAGENRALVEAKIVAEQHLEQAHFEQNRSENATDTFNTHLQDRDAEIMRLKEEVASLHATHDSLRQEHERNLFDIHDQHEQAQSEWQGSSKELETLRSRHNELSTGMESIVRHEIDTALAEKNAEIQRLRGDLDIAREQVRELQSQILAQPSDNVVVSHDEDYFDQACQKLCQQVQGWVLRFSKFSDLKLCRGTNEVRDEKIVDRFDNAILDGSDVDNYLTDRVKRRDVFMSVVMTMIWEYVFTRYLFGMDREQRQKLKLLEKNLGEVGPTGAVHQWRALTLTLLSKRESFKAQRESDTEAVAIEIFSTLSRFLPPPQNLEEQIVGSFRTVMRTAVDLSIEMRTQRAEYMMLPPLSPEYDTNGDLARKVYFNASLMNERSGETNSNEDLEHEQAVVRMVLFPLVVKKGDDDGVGDDEIVVCPAQVLIAKPDKSKKTRSSMRNTSGGSDAKSLRAISTHSLAMSGIEGNDNMF